MAKVEEDEWQTQQPRKQRKPKKKSEELDLYEEAGIEPPPSAALPQSHQTELKIGTDHDWPPNNGTDSSSSPKQAPDSSSTSAVLVSEISDQPSLEVRM